MKKTNFAIIELEVLSGETIYDFIERMVKEKDRLVESDCFDYENFVMIGEFNECAVICHPDSKKEEILKAYNKGIKYDVAFDAYKYLGSGGDALIKEMLADDSAEKALTIIEFDRDDFEYPDELCRKILNLNSMLAKDPYVPNYAIVGSFNDLAVVCRSNNTFDDLMMQVAVNKLPYEQVKNLYRTIGDQMDFVIANIAKILSEEELAAAQKDLAVNINEIRATMKNRLKKKEAMPAKKEPFDNLNIGCVAYLTNDTEKFPKGTKVSVKAYNMINSVIPVVIVGVGDDIFCVSPNDLSTKSPEKSLASYIDHTLLKANATKSDIIKLCEEAKQNKFASVCVNPSFVALCNELLEDTEVKVCTVIGFPLGANPIVDKTNESLTAIENGADELDYVINIGAVKDHNWTLIKHECEAMAALQHDGRIVKVILETCLLNVEEIQKVCEIAARAGIEFVKTSTGFSTGGAEEHIVSLMKESVSVWNKNTKVKASGGIRTKEDAIKMIKAGADRIGTSAGCTIVQ